MKKEIIKQLIDKTPNLEFRERIRNAEQRMKAIGEDIDIPINYTFSSGLCVKEAIFNKGTILTSAVHKTEYIVIIIGDVEIVDESGVNRYTGLHTFVSKPGIKRLIIVHEDTIMFNAHATNIKDPIPLRKELLCETYEEFDRFREQLIKKYQLRLENKNA